MRVQIVRPGLDGRGRRRDVKRGDLGGRDGKGDRAPPWWVWSHRGSQGRRPLVKDRVGGLVGWVKHVANEVDRLGCRPGVVEVEDRVLLRCWKHKRGLSSCGRSTSTAHARDVKGVACGVVVTVDERDGACHRGGENGGCCRGCFGRKGVDQVGAAWSVVVGRLWELGDRLVDV